MEINFQIRGHCYSMVFGHKTKWFEQIPFFMLEERFYENREVEYARVIFCI